MAEGVESMKKGIHPTYQKTTVTCVNCGETFEVGSTAKEIRVEVCSQCHPFYTGKETYVQAAGRVERFKKRYGMQESDKEPKKATAAQQKRKNLKLKKQLMQHLKKTQKKQKKLIKKIYLPVRRYFFCI